MDMNRTALIALTALAIMLTAATCTGGDGPSRLYAGGTNGLIFSFEQGAPPPIIYDGGQTPMPILLNVQNDGEFDTQDLHVWISGISENDFAGLNRYPSIEDEPARYVGRAIFQDDVVEGQTYVLDLGEASFERELSSTGSLPYTLRTNVCYGYATRATAQVCFEEDYYDSSDTCDPEVSSLQTSGAPVQIRNLETSAMGSNTLRLSFEVSKANNANVWLTSGSQTCDPASRQERSNEEGWVYVRVDDRFDGDLTKCSPLFEKSGDDGNLIFSYEQEYLDTITSMVRRDEQGYVRVSNGPASVTCTIEVPEGGEGVSTVDIALAYFVEDTISHEFTVEHSNAND